MTSPNEHLHDGRVTRAVTADNVPETDPRWAGWWAHCSCGWETFDAYRDDSQHALDLHLEDPESYPA